MLIEKLLIYDADQLVRDIVMAFVEFKVTETMVKQSEACQIPEYETSTRHTSMNKIDNSIGSVLKSFCVFLIASTIAVFAFSMMHDEKHHLPDCSHMSVVETIAHMVNKDERVTHKDEIFIDLTAIQEISYNAKNMTKTCKAELTTTNIAQRPVAYDIMWENKDLNQFLIQVIPL